MIKFMMPVGATPHTNIRSWDDGVVMVVVVVSGDGDDGGDGDGVCGEFCY